MLLRFPFEVSEGLMVSHTALLFAAPARLTVRKVSPRFSLIVSPTADIPMTMRSCFAAVPSRD